MELVWIIVTRRPTAEWIAQQITEAFPWKEAPRYLIRDQDGVYGVAVTESGHALAFMSTRLETRLRVGWLRVTAGQGRYREPPLSAFGPQAVSFGHFVQ